MSEPDRAGAPDIIRYGLHFFDGEREVRLWLISGGSRIQLMSREGELTKIWWCRRPKGVDWQVYKTEVGQTYTSEIEAEVEAANLTR